MLEHQIRPGQQFVAAPLVAPHEDIPRPADAEVPVWFTIGTGIGLTALALVFFRGIQTTHIGKLMMERGMTQAWTLLLACMVVVFLIAKLGRLTHLYVAVRRAARPKVVDWRPEDTPTLLRQRWEWIQAGDVPSLRLARALQAYLVSRRRSTATDAAQQDADLATAASDATYTFPRTLIWAIPLMGFIGTVVGISEAVAGFSGFLQQAEEIEQIKQGISRVTTGLAVAFDTTLVALVISIGLMLPLVLLERFEGRLLLALEGLVNDRVLARLPEGEDVSAPGANSLLDAELIDRAVQAAVDRHLPAPADLLRGVEQYARELSAVVLKQFQADATAVGLRLEQTSARVQQVTDQMLATQVRTLEALDITQSRIAAALQQQQQRQADAAVAQAEAVRQAAAGVLAAVEGTSRQAAAALRSHADDIARSLDAIGERLTERLRVLEAHAEALTDLTRLERSLAGSLQALETTGQLTSVLSEVGTSVRALHPMIERLGQPRRVMLVESSDGEVPILTGTLATRLPADAIDKMDSTASSAGSAATHA